MIFKAQTKGNAELLDKLEAAKRRKKSDKQYVVGSEESTEQETDPASHTPLKERLESYYGKPFDEIPRASSRPEVDWGKPVGEEVW